MEDSFRARVDKVFGALGGDAAAAAASASESAGVSPSLWCLTDDEIERREWNRSKGVEGVGDGGVESVVRDKLESDLGELSDCADEEGEEFDGETKKRRRDSRSGAETDDEYLDIQSNIGRDCTLDFEEEEDAYDQMAVGTEWKGDRIYMRDVKSDDYGIDECSAYDEFPNSFQDVVKDPRANHMAAKMRLKEDAEAVGSFDALQLSDNSATPNAQAEDLPKSEVNGENIKSILKKRESLSESRSQKRVRFLADPKNSTQINEDSKSSGVSGLATELHSRDVSAASEQASDCPQFSSSVPDYLRNPSRYTRYTLDSSEDGQSKIKKYRDLVQYVRERIAESPKSITFTPKRKPQDSSSSMKRSDSEHATHDYHKKKGWSIDVSAEDNEESEVSAMEEDQPSITSDKGCNFHKPSRQYRTRSNVDDDGP